MKSSEYFNLMAIAFVAPHVPHVYAAVLSSVCVVLSIVSAGIDGSSKGGK